MDLRLIAGEFLYDDSVPKQQRWLLKYFKNDQQKRFLAYYLEFNSLRERSAGHFYQNFIDHTGIHCMKRAMQKWIKKLKDLELAATSAAERFDFAMLEKIKSGRYRFGRNVATTCDHSDG